MNDQATTAAQPQVKSGVAPYLTVSDANAAAEFYKRAFAAEEVARLPAGPQDPRLMHCHLYINGGSVMLSDGFPEHGHPAVPPQGFNLHLQVEDAESWWKRAVDAGAEVRMPLQRMFWGDLYGQLVDPFGVLWAIGAR